MWKHCLGVCVVIMACGCGRAPAIEAPSARTNQSVDAVGREQPGEKPQKADSSREANTPLASVPTRLLSDKELAEGWLQLFDGHTLFGWTANSDAEWKVKDGVILVESGTPGQLMTNVPFSDFEFFCEFRLSKGGNSGVFLRSAVKPTDPGRDCYELNICDSHPAFPTGSLVARKKGPGGITVEGEWHAFRVTMSGTRITVDLDGRRVIDLDDKTKHALTSGRIGFQMNEGRAEFRNVRLRPVGTSDLFDGRSLDGWRVVPMGKSRFSVVDGTIHVEDGAGFLETKSTWGDFLLQAQARTNGKELNSGIFFRTERGTAEQPSNGYEVQIHNGTTAGNRLKPSNAGTGAIFRRNTARFVAAQDHQWAYLSVAAVGARFCVWVNGLQVTDWVDTREENSNPRKGRRLKAGHISLQGHDPTTDLDFRSIRILPLP